MVGSASCSDEWQEEESAEVSFTTVLPTNARSRSFGKAEQVKTLVVGIFNEKKEEIGRKTVAVSSASVDVQLALAQNQTYSFVFWAYDSSQNIYNINDLKAIQMNTLPDPITFSEAEAADAFVATKENITISGDCSYSVTLVRPLAQINVGTTGTPMQATFTASGTPNIFHSFTNTVSGAAEFIWNFSETTSETFSADGTEYNYLAMGYVFAPTTAANISAELTLTDGDTSKTVEFPQVEIEANQRSNIAGNFTPTE